VKTEEKETKKPWFLVETKVFRNLVDRFGGDKRDRTADLLNAMAV